MSETAGAATARFGRRRVGLVLALLALGGLVVYQLASPPRLAFEITSASVGATSAFGPFDAVSVALADFDGDGRAEIVAQNDNQRVYVFSSKEPRLLAEIAPPYPPGWTVRAFNEPSVADVDADGALDIVVTTSAATTCVYEHAGGFEFEERWCRRADDYDGGVASSDAGPWVEDVTGDGRAEIFVQTEEKGLFAFTAEGEKLWSRADDGGNAGPVVGDLDDDGKKEVLFFSDAGVVRALDAATGSLRWRFDAAAHVRPGSIPVAGTLGDLNGDGLMEVAFTARHAERTDDLRANHFALFVLQPDGTLAWKAQPAWGNPLSYTHLVVADVAGDARLEILGMDWNTMGHKPGNWEDLGDAHAFAFDAFGEELWHTEVDVAWSNDDVLLANADRDRALELLVVGLGPDGRDGVWILDAVTGEKERHVAAPGWTLLRGPVAGDFDGSGTLQWIVPAVRPDAPDEGALLVFGSGIGCRVVAGGWKNTDPCGASDAPAPVAWWRRLTPF